MFINEISELFHLMKRICRFHVAARFSDSLFADRFRLAFARASRNSVRRTRGKSLRPNEPKLDEREKWRSYFAMRTFYQSPKNRADGGGAEEQRSIAGVERSRIQSLFGARCTATENNVPGRWQQPTCFIIYRIIS